VPQSIRLTFGCNKTIEDCLTEAMDIDDLIELLQKIESGEVECIARDLPRALAIGATKFSTPAIRFSGQPRLWKERRTQAVYTRRANESSARAVLAFSTAAANRQGSAATLGRARSMRELKGSPIAAGVMTG